LSFGLKNFPLTLFFQKENRVQKKHFRFFKNGQLRFPSAFPLNPFGKSVHGKINLKILLPEGLP